MIEEIDRANDIITTYLSLSKASVETSPCNLSALITAFAPVLDAEGMMRDACIHYDLSSSSLVLVNEAEIRQMLANLVRNALEAMPDAGVVRINTQETEDGVTISVSDGGCGIPAELLSKLGTPFLTTKQQGTGLGLSVCYRIAERHNARIEVETSAKGSTFRVVFPKS